MINGDNGSDPTDPNADGLLDGGDPNAADPTDPNASSPSDPGASDPDPNADPDSGQPRRQTAKDRIDELTRLRREAERDAEYWRSKALQTPQAPAQQTPQAEGPPDPDKYDAGEFDTRFIRDTARWEAKQEVAHAIKGLSAQSEADRIEAAYQSRVAKTATELPDFEEKVVEGAKKQAWACSPVLADAIKMSDRGPEIAYALASDPTEAARIYGLPPAFQLIEVGKLEAKLTQPKARTVTNAPGATPQVRGSGGKFTVAPDTNDFAAFDKQFGNGS